MLPPNRGYSANGGPHNTPLPMRFDLADLPKNLVCPNCGNSIFLRIGSTIYGVRCQQCGTQGDLGGVPIRC
jgi:rubredoxin